MPLDHDSSVPKLLGEHAHLVEHEIHGRVIRLLDLPAVDPPHDPLAEIPAVGEEVDHHGVGENLLVLGPDLRERLRRQRLGVFVLCLGILRLRPELLDHREVHHLIERYGGIRDRADATVEIVGLLPDPLEVGRVVSVDEELVVLGPVRAVGIAEHRERVGGGDVVAGRHQFGGLRPGGFGLEQFHRVEDAPHDRFDLVGMILGEVGPCKPDVGDQPVRRLGGDEHAVALGLLQVVDVGCPRHAAGKILLRVEGRGRLKGIFGIDHVHVARLQPTGHQHVEGKELTR